MKNFAIIFCLIFLILLTAITKTSSKKIEEKIFIINESIRTLKDKYNLVYLEYTYLSNPSRLVDIMKNDKNEEYIHLDASKLKTILKKNDKQ